MSNVIQLRSSDDGDPNWMMDVACDVLILSRETGLAAWSPTCENRAKAVEDMQAQGLLEFNGNTAKLTLNGLGWYADMLLNQHDNTKASKRYLDSKGFLMMVVGALGSKIWDETAEGDPGLDKRTWQVISRIFSRKGPRVMSSDMNTNKIDPLDDEIRWSSPGEVSPEPTPEELAERMRRDQEWAKISTISDIVGDNQPLAWLMELSLNGGGGGYLYDSWYEELAGELVGNGWCEIDPDGERLVITAAGYQCVVDAYWQAVKDGYDVSDQLIEAAEAFEERQTYDREVDSKDRTNIVLASARYYHMMSPRLRSKFWDETAGYVDQWPVSEQDKRMVAAGFASCAALSVCNEAAKEMMSDAPSRLGFALYLDTSSKGH